MQKRVLIGVSGGVAAYKAVELVRLARKSGACVQVVLTKAATRFITPLTFQAVSGNPAWVNLWDPKSPDGMDHIRLADETDLAIVAPASADLIGRLAGGLSQDLLTTMLLAYRGTVILAPAMNDQMYENPLVQKNLQSLAQLGFEVVGPGQGELACGHHGLGRMSEPQEIWQRAQEILRRKQDLQGFRVLVTAGPTQEPLDSVRFLTNHSSGKMGYALARAAQGRGAQTTLVSGPTSLASPKGVEVVRVTTARQMYDQVMQHANADLIIMAAAVSDFSFAEQREGKVNRKNFPEQLKLVPNPDILADLGDKRSRGELAAQVLVGFSMETKNLLSRSQQKLAEKQVDFIVANQLDESGAGFGVDTNKVILLQSDVKAEEFPLLTKTELAERLLDRFLPYLHKKAENVALLSGRRVAFAKRGKGNQR